MVTRLDYLECEYGDHLEHEGDCPGEPTVCQACGWWDGTAPWSYEELIGAIGLCAMWRLDLEQSMRAGLPMKAGREWLVESRMVFLQPAMAIRAMQAGVQFSAPALVHQPQPPRGKLIH